MAGHAQALLHGAVRVVEEGAVLVHGELVHGPLAGPDGLLADAVNAIDAVGNFKAVQVQDGRFREHVVDDEAHPVPLSHLDGGAGHAAGVTPDVDPLAGEELPPRVHAV
jgi:hypothetical protein